MALLEWVQNVVFVTIAVWAARRWRRRDTASDRWVAATFGALAVVVIVGWVGDLFADGTVLSTLLSLVSLAGLVGFPYLLLRFHDTFDPVPRWLRQLVLALGAVVFVLAIPLLGGDGESSAPALMTVVLALLMVYWVAPLATVAVRFWRAGRQQPTLVRRRVRLLATGTAMLGLALLLVAAQQDPDPVFQFLVQLVSVAAAGLFLVGFAPPAPLETHWRQAEERALHEASVRLMGSVTPQEVATLLVPHLRAVLAARGVALVHHGRVLVSEGVAVDDMAAIGDDEVVVSHQLRDGALHVWPNAYTPFFSDEESDLVERLAVLTDLALARTGLLLRERQAREELESVNAELESFVYSASHDLKSPLIAIQSYIDMFHEAMAEHLDEDTTWYLERMRTNTSYMSALVGDLLELSRVGRVETSPDTVDTAALVEEVAIEVQEQHPQAEVHVGDLPMMRANPLRCRQLFSNLVGNAAAHAEGEDVTIWVESRPADDGDGVVVLVRDDGPGIPAEYRERVFGVFERLRADDGSKGSTGIGLAICRKIVEGFGGRIWVTGHEDGAEFAIHLPVTALADTARDHSTTEVHA